LDLLAPSFKVRVQNTLYLATLKQNEIIATLIMGKKKHQSAKTKTLAEYLLHIKTVILKMFK